MIVVLLAGVLLWVVSANVRSTHASERLRQATEMDAAMQTIARQMDADADRAARERGEVPPPHIARSTP